MAVPTPKPPWPWSLPGTIGFRSQSGWTLGLPRRRLDSTCPPRPGHGKWVGALAVCVCVCCSDCRAAVVVPWFSTLLGVIHRIPSPAPLTGTVFLPPLPLDSAEAVASTVLWISSTSSVSQRKVFIRNHPHQHQRLSLLHPHDTQQLQPYHGGRPRQIPRLRDLSRSQSQVRCALPPFPLIFAAKRLTPLPFQETNAPFANAASTAAGPAPTSVRPSLLLRRSRMADGVSLSLHLSTTYTSQLLILLPLLIRLLPPSTKDSQEGQVKVALSATPTRGPATGGRRTAGPGVGRCHYCFGSDPGDEV